MHFKTTCLPAENESRLLARSSCETRIATHRLLAVLTLAAGVLAAPANAADEPKAIFRKRCTGCHTFGKGIKVGPDLKGVTERRTREWLLRFIRGSSGVIQSGDPIATKLFRDFKQERMPDWSDLSPQQVVSILDYFATDGPLQKEPDERDATTATQDEIESGRRLFHGATRLNFGGLPCHTCHSIHDRDSKEGSLGPDLTGAYLKYRDRALTDFLKRPCFAREPDSFAAGYLTPQESFDLKAYMAKTAGLPIPQPPPPEVK